MQFCAPHAHDPVTPEKTKCTGVAGGVSKCTRGLTSLTVIQPVFPQRNTEEQERKMLQLGKLLNGGRESKRAVIVSVGEFYPGDCLQRRPGATRDAKKLHKTLSKMGFKVDIHIDLNSDEIYELFHQGRDQECMPESA